jgi:hypothetical protein
MEDTCIWPRFEERRNGCGRIDARLSDVNSGSPIDQLNPHCRLCMRKLYTIEDEAKRCNSI